MRPVCAVDTETTGLHWGREAWEIAFVKRWPDGNVIEQSYFVDVDLKWADPKALEIGGFYERYPVGIYLTTGRKTGERVLSAEDAAQKILQWTHGATIVGAQPHFDTHTLSCLLHKHGLQPSWHYRLVDVESLTAGHFGFAPGGLAKCAEALGIEFPTDQQHTALGDARVALALYDKILGGES